MIQRALTVAVLIVSGSQVSGDGPDEIGAFLAQQIEDLGGEFVARVIVPERADAIVRALAWLRTADLVLVAGGTAPMAPDVAYQAILKYIELPTPETPEQALPTSAAGRDLRPGPPWIAVPPLEGATPPALVVAPETRAEAGPLVVIVPGELAAIEAVWSCVLSSPRVATLIADRVALLDRTLVFGPGVDTASLLRHLDDAPAGLEVSTEQLFDGIAVRVRIRYLATDASLYQRFEDTLLADCGPHRLTARSVAAALVDASAALNDGSHPRAAVIGEDLLPLLLKLLSSEPE